MARAKFFPIFLFIIILFRPVEAHFLYGKLMANYEVIVILWHMYGLIGPLCMMEYAWYGMDG